MKLSQSDLIDGYWEEVKDQYPDIPKATFSEIIRAYTTYIVNCIKSIEMPDIYVKGLCIFKVFKGRLIKKLKELEDYKDRHEAKEYEDRRDFLQNHLNKIYKMESLVDINVRMTNEE